VSLAPTADIPIERARTALRAHLGPQAASHGERTGATARVLAVRFGADADAAELAGLLHDWSRQESGEELLAFADRAGLAVLPAERETPHLLHSRVAAEQVREAFPGVRLEVLSAIAAHTVGALPMSALDKIVFIADAIEPARDYAGVDELRELAGSCALDDVFADAYARSIAFVRAKGAPLHPMTALVAAQIERETGRSPLGVPDVPA
jgi:predicted HD superfamily hydrolase involved in NAD metabolism